MKMCCLPAFAIIWTGFFPSQLLAQATGSPTAQFSPRIAAAAVRRQSSTASSGGGAIEKMSNRPDHPPQPRRNPQVLAGARRGGAATRSPQHANIRPRFRAGTEMNIPSARSDRVAIVGGPGTISNEPGRKAVPARRVGAIRPAAAFQNAVPHRSPNPAVVSGSANLHRRPSGTLSGTGMSRRR
jgi:hypothetical protein